MSVWGSICKNTGQRNGNFEEVMVSSEESIVLNMGQTFVTQGAKSKHFNNKIMT